MSERDFFLSHLGQTTPFPFLVEVERAEGIYIYDKQGKAYMDMISGVAVNNIGHRHPKVISALKNQIDKYLHVMVYGEFIQDSQQLLVKELLEVLPDSLDGVYVVNSGTEAIEAALKLAKRVTGRTELISFRGSYHGSTHGSMSVSGNEVKKQAFRPLLPDVQFLQLNQQVDLERITEKTAGVILETIQGDAGVRRPSVTFMKALRQRCDEVGALLILDEIQCGMGRTGKLFAFEHFDIVPDILTLGKALGGGMPIGALVSSQKRLMEFTHAPMLGHITTFGGHPVICAAAAAAVQVLKSEIEWKDLEVKAQRFEERFNQHPEIVEIRRVGMMFAFDMVSAERVERVVSRCMEKGLITFWFLSHPYSFRLSPPLTITEDELNLAADLILQAIEETRID
ncbi:MAG: aspartate aminotransferase family protein [Crocinitomicaceae bacterium]|nr:aspartate aminotransferase family protein [Crocinitomicaceae bacterium]MBP6032202.1 aspartate aminotransferase family protein [Crocinitomicaceae bacterium]